LHTFAKTLDLAFDSWQDFFASVCKNDKPVKDIT
jgi:hypothetical protein